MPGRIILYMRNCPQDKSQKIQGTKKDKQSPGETEEEIILWVIPEGVKRLNHMSSEDQAALGVKNSSKIVNTKVENDECTTVHSEVQCEKPTAQVGFLKYWHIWAELKWALQRGLCIGQFF